MAVEQRIGGGTVFRFLLTAACFVVVVAGLREAETVVTTFLVSAFLAMLGLPILQWLLSKRVPSFLAVPIVLLLIVGILAATGTLVGGSLNQFTSALPRYQSRLRELAEPIGRSLSDQFGWETLFNMVDPGVLLQMAGTTLGRLASILTNVVVILLTTIFILFEAIGFPRKLEAVLRASGQQLESVSRFAHVVTQVRNYLVIKTGVSLLTGILVGTWVWAWDVEFPFLWGVMAFLLNYIPSLGSIIAAIPPVALALIQPEGGLTLAVIIAAGYLAVNVVLGNGVEPRLMGQRLGLSSLVVFLSLGFWGWVWGGIGMLLSVPLTMIVKILLQNTDDFRWLAILLGPTDDAALLAEEASSSESTG